MGLDSNGRRYERWATANRCAVFRRGYLELIGVEAPGRVNPWAAFLERFEGPHLLALRCADAVVARHALGDGACWFDPPVERRREAPYRDGTAEMRFRNVFSRDPLVPECRYIVIEHQTPEVLWERSVQVHPNGAHSLLEGLCRAPAEPAARAAVRARWEALARVGGRMTDARNGFWLDFPDGTRIGCLDRDAMDARFPGAQASQRAFVTACQVGVTSLDAAAQCLDGAGVTVARTRIEGTGPERLWVAPDEANGLVVEFVETPFPAAAAGGREA